jgi:hypothetical protein
MISKLSILISTCDKFSDLWEAHIDLYLKNWHGGFCKTYLVTDKATTRHFEDVKIIVADNGLDFPMRIKYALDFIETPYVLLTLDDYFLFKNVYNEKIKYLVDCCETQSIDYLLLYDRRMTKEKHYKSIETITPIDLNKKYALTLYPAIWSVEFLRKTVPGNLSPWHYEVSLTQAAIKENANCQFSQAGTFDILDVIRKGKVLHKAKHYFTQNNINIGDRPTISRIIEVRLAFMDWISWYSPRWLFRIVKKTAKRFGLKFYSDN